MGLTPTIGLSQEGYPEQGEEEAGQEGAAQHHLRGEEYHPSESLREQVSNKFMPSSFTGV